MSYVHTIPKMRYKETTAPTVEPVTYAEVRISSRIDTDDEKDFVQNAIVAARKWCEMFMRRSLVTRTYTGRLDSFPSNRIGLPMPPAIAITSISYLDVSGNSQTLATSVYDLDIASEWEAQIFLKYNQTYPATRDIENAVTIVWTAGHGAAASNVPEEAKQAIMLLVDHWYTNRGTVLVGSISKELEHSLSSLLWSLRTSL